MREFSYSVLLDDYFFMRKVVSDLKDEAFEFLTPDECDAERRALLEELRMDYSFKLLTRLEADIREDFNQTIRRKLRDGVSKVYRDLCDAYRRGTRRLSQQATRACSKIPIDRIFDKLRDHFAELNDEFHRVCSDTKGYFSFRNWYAHGRSRYAPVIPDPEDIFTIYERFQVAVFGRR